MTILSLYVVTVVLFLAADVAGLRLIVRPVFDRYIGPLLRERPEYGPALVFYLFYIVGLLWFVSVPALAEGTPLAMVFALGAFFGAISYGTYEFSNMATLKGWTWTMLWTDLIWGTVLTGFAAAGGVALVRAFG